MLSENRLLDQTDLRFHLILSKNKRKESLKMNQVNRSIATTYQVLSMRLVFRMSLRSKKLNPETTVFPNRLSRRHLMTSPIKEKSYAY